MEFDRSLARQMFIFMTEDSGRCHVIRRGDCFCSLIAKGGPGRVPRPFPPRRPHAGPPAERPIAVSDSCRRVFPVASAVRSLYFGTLQRTREKGHPQLSTSGKWSTPRDVAAVPRIKYSASAGGAR
ncbi:hypothetical protein EVAR_37766_1 [Eumeta japonica]|uniref:Uncharacterized protein n=1 Tax=Eumeta variegata TaxID=151549 RepID=A0A4C1WLT3_EUMVA|nr:hypothetical protein EVAR_37766_1 [Eumeta japonica]